MEKQSIKKQNDTDHKTFSADRRNVLIGAGALGASAVAAMALGGTDVLAGGMHHHGARRDEALIKVLHQCVRTGEACIDHCLNLFKKGDVETVDCMRSVIDTMAFCKAHAQTASRHARRICGHKTCAQLCIDRSPHSEQHHWPAVFRRSVS